MQKFKTTLLSFCLKLGVLLFITLTANAQKEIPASTLLHQLKGLKTNACALYIAAHPDDENTRLLTWLAQEKQWRTAYLSLTRGDGGQNLIGNEKGYELGVLRTQELLAARRIDGAEQYFSRAIDFGYSKKANETFEIWQKDEILKDVVWVIRKLKPDVIITRFPPDYRAGHGHHTASAMLAIEAYEQAANPNFKFNDSRDGVFQPWHAKRVVWNTSSWAYKRAGIEFPPKGVIEQEVGQYNALLGKNYSSLASLARSEHRSQGFGSLISRGSTLEYFEHLKGDSAIVSIFEGIDDSWFRFNDYKTAKKIQQTIDKMLNTFDVSNPSASISTLIELKNLIAPIGNAQWKKYQLSKIDELIAACAGLWFEAGVDRHYACPNDSVELRITMANRSDIKVGVNLISLDDLAFAINLENLNENVLTEVLKKKIWIPSDPIMYSQPYWLRKEAAQGIYGVNFEQDIGAAELRPFSEVNILVEIAGESIKLKAPITYKWQDRAKGELHRPFEVRPRITLNFEKQVYLFGKGQSKQVQVNLLSNTQETKGVLSLKVPKGWNISPEKYNFNTSFSGEKLSYSFTITPSNEAISGQIEAVALAEGRTFNLGMTNISYEHIPDQVIFPEAKSKLMYADIEASEIAIAYLPGAGDEIAACLSEIGYKINELNPTQINQELLDKYKVVIVGIRAYNTVENISNIHKELMEFVEKGGKVIMQYNTLYGLKHPVVGPYDLTISRDRITDENSPIDFLAPNHPILNQPNKINQEDFEGWVQERGLYFPAEWSSEYTPILGAKDEGEEAQSGLLLVTTYGKGKFVQTGLSFFRELPAGVGGAYRLFVNMIEY